MVVNKSPNDNPWISFNQSIPSISSSSEEWPYSDQVNILDSFGTTEDLVEWKDNFNRRQINLENIAIVNDSGGRKTSMKAVKMHGRNVVNAAKSLDLLRQNIQSIINKDIDKVIKKYLDIYFVPAINNIRNNLGHGSVNEEHIRELCRTMLDEAKHLYLNSPLSRSDSPFNAAADPKTLIHSRFGNSHEDTDSGKPFSNFIESFEITESAPIVSHQFIASDNCQTIMDGVPNYQAEKSQQRISSKTLFILSSKVNKVMVNSGINEPLHVKHSELFHYQTDEEDRDWLVKHFLSLQNPGLSYVLILEEVHKLLNSGVYQNNMNILRHELKGFEAPQFMLEKMRLAEASTENHSLSHSCTNNVVDSGFVMYDKNVVVETVANKVFRGENNFLTNNVFHPTNESAQVKEMKKIPQSNWTEEAMQKALRLISRGRSQRYVERKFGIPRRTLRNRLKISAHRVIEKTLIV